MIFNKFTNSGSKERVFLESAMAEEGILTLSEFFMWFESRREANSFEVKKVPLSQLQGWFIEQETGNLIHKSGKFFRIEGLEVETNFGLTRRWTQPIINQPEVGILGFLTKKINGILHFLVQVKMEPGNVNLLQLSPTVQATRSNYTQVHGGKRPPYLDYFLNGPRVHVPVDQLQSEQGSRFLRKRNRNIIIEVDENESVNVLDDFCWLTLGQLFELLKIDNLVNMDSRTVLSCIRFTGEGDPDLSFNGDEKQDFHEAVLMSSLSKERMAVNDFDTIISWLTSLKTRYELNVRRIPLNQVENWEFDGEEIRHRSGRFFSVIGVSVTASNREVQGWDQPLIESAKGGVLCFVCQRKKGVLQFLVQGRVEPGNFDGVEMSPTLQCTTSNYDADKPERLPPFYDLVLNARPEQIRFSTLQSEEGGRFYHDQNRYLVVEVDEDHELALPENYIWMTIRQMKEFIRFNNYLNIEARGLLSCLDIKMSKTY